MTIFNSAYQTLAGALYRDTDKTREHVYTALMYSDLYQVKPGVYCVKYGERSGSIPGFNYPLVFKDVEAHMANESPYPGSVVVFDARSLISTVRDERNPTSVNIRDLPKFQALVLHSSLALAWENGEVNIARDIGNYPFAVFSWWLAETIVKRFTLDGNAQLLLMVLSAIWYQSNFVNFKREDADAKYKTELVTVIDNVFKLRLRSLADVVDKYPVIYDINDFIEVVKELLDNRKLDILNASVFTSTIGGSWIGAIGREQIVVATEYPPQWITLIAQAASDRGYKIAKLTAVAERNSFMPLRRSFGQAAGELSSFDLR